MAVCNVDCVARGGGGECVTEATVSGLDEVLAKLQFVSDKSTLSIARSMVRGGLNVVAKKIKSDLDPKAKDAKKSVKGRFKKGKVKIVAKVGFGVGPRNKKRATTKERTRGGVGIGPNNIHWWVAGTRSRWTKRPVRYVGRMPAMQPGLARIAYAQSVGKIKSEMIKRGALQLKKEIVKLQKVK